MIQTVTKILSNLIRLIPIIYVVTPLGSAEAHFIQVPIGDDGYANWGCFQSETKEQWWFDNSCVRLVGSITGRRGDNYSPIYLSDEMFDILIPHILRHKKSPFYNKAIAIHDTMGNRCESS